MVYGSNSADTVVMNSAMTIGTCATTFTSIEGTGWVSWLNGYYLDIYLQGGDDRASIGLVGGDGSGTITYGSAGADKIEVGDESAIVVGGGDNDSLRGRSPLLQPYNRTLIGDGGNDCLESNNDTGPFFGQEVLLYCVAGTDTRRLCGNPAACNCSTGVGCDFSCGNYCRQIAFNCENTTSSPCCLSKASEVCRSSSESCAGVCATAVGDGVKRCCLSF